MRVVWWREEEELGFWDGSVGDRLREASASRRRSRGVWVDGLELIGRKTKKMSTWRTWLGWMEWGTLPLNERSLSGWRWLKA
jgi:hypothetical protein